jgi:hypothetical protein
MPTKEEYLALEKKKAQAVQQRNIDPQLLRAAAIQSEHLTGLPEWDQYLTKLQPLLEQAEQEADHWLKQLGVALTDEQLRKSQLEYHSWKSRAETLKTVMQLPSMIIEAHREHRA